MYTSPQNSLEIVAHSTSKLLTNSILYYSSSTPDSINKIIFDICDGITSVCSTAVPSYIFTIRKLKSGYIPSLSGNDTISVTTSLGEIIAQKVLDTSLYSPTLILGSLNMAVSNSVTNSFSGFQFSFTSTEVSFDRQLSFTLPSSLTIYGPCSLTTSLAIGITYNCSNVFANSISLSFDLDQNLMIPQNITYTITLANVSTPTSMAPLLYTLATKFNGTTNQKFSILYSMQSSYPISTVYTKTNYTINQPFRLSLTMKPAVSQYDSWQIILPKSTVYIEASWVSTFIFSENTTHYILNQTGMMSNNYT